MADPQASPAGALSAFEAAATKWEAVAPDAEVSDSFTLGWRSGEAVTYAGGGAPPQDSAPPLADLQLDRMARWAVLGGQIDAARRRVSADTKAVPSLAPDGANAKEVPACLLKALYSCSATLGQAFRLGFGLQQLCAAPAGELHRSSAWLKELLATLSSKLPPHAAHSVRNSLTLWEEQIADASSATGDALVRQGAWWRAVLAGEVAAKDALHMVDFVGTAEEVVGELRKLVRSTLWRRLAPLAVLVLVLIGVGIFVLIRSDSASAVTAGAGSLIAAFGLTWKGLGTFLGHEAAKGEQALWDAQIDWSIAYRATILVGEPQAKRTAADRSRKSAHLRTFQKWQERWPDLDSRQEG
jgi:hypothetical protein